MNEITTEQQIRVACEIAGINITELAKRFGTSQQNLSKRLKVGKFTKEELEKIGSILGATYKSGFYFPDGNKIE